VRTIAVIARKGGSGKTTVATHLALAAHLRGLKTLVADTDPQRSSTVVLQARVADGPDTLESSGGKLFALQVSARRAGTEALIIDTPAGAEDELAHAIVLSDLCLLVLRPTFLDMAAALRTVEVVRRLRKPAFVVVNQAPPARAGVEPPQVRKALKALGQLRLPVLPIVLRTRAAYQLALETGRSAEELSVDPAAAQEIGALWDFIERFAFTRRPAAGAEAQAAALA
jgi:chromosome partitioning protein